MSAMTPNLRFGCSQFYDEQVEKGSNHASYKPNHYLASGEFVPFLERVTLS